MNSKHLVSKNKLDEWGIFIGELEICVAYSEMKV